MTVKHIDIGRDFSEKLGPRYENLGPFSGELFYRTLLHPAYLENDLVVVSLDSFKNLSASFFEEAFGGLVRDHGLPEVEQKLKFDTARRGYLVPMIQVWMHEAEERRKKGKRK